MADKLRSEMHPLPLPPSDCVDYVHNSGPEGTHCTDQTGDFELNGRPIYVGYDWRTLDLTKIDYRVSGVPEKDIREQLRLEEEALLDGVAAFRRRMDKAIKRGDAGAVGGYRRIMEALLGPIAKCFQEELGEQARRRPQRRAHVLRLLPLDPGDPQALLLTAEQLAYLTIKATIGAIISGDNRLQSVLVAIGKAVELEANAANFEASEGKEAEAYIRRLQATTSHKRHIRGALLYAMRMRGIRTRGWSINDYAKVGGFLLEKARQVVNFIDFAHEHRAVSPRYGGGSHTTEIRVSLIPELMEWALNQTFLDALVRPLYSPMIIPPRPWIKRKGGGYLAMGALRKTSLIKLKDPQHAAVLDPDIKDGKLDLVLEAVNRVQNTAWRVNEDVLSVASHMYDEGYEWAGLVSSVALAMPPKPYDIDTNEEARNEWKRRATAVHEENIKLTTKRFRVASTLKVAADFAKHRRIYFPHKMDFRGRLYPVISGLDPQGDDLGRGLLTFAQGKPINDEKAQGWFMVHGANVYGKDKLSFAGRKQWAKDNHEMIVECARDPWANRRWAEADNPFQFLAWCFEYLKWIEDPEGFLSYIPIALDGTCNGIQHFAALLRDEVAGASVNLLPAKEPQDIYRVVAERAEKLIRKDSRLSPDIAKGICSFGIRRGEAKPAVMVLPYGGSNRTFHSLVSDKVGEAIQKRDPERQWPWPDCAEETHAALNAISHAVVKAMYDEVGSGTQVLLWLREIIGVLAEDEIALVWTVPDGLSISSRYLKDLATRVETAFNGRTQLWLEDNADAYLQQGGKRSDLEPDFSRIMSATPPNFVHSLDACALRSTVLAMPEGTAFAMIHDSYGTHAADTEQLALELRGMFLTIYALNDPLDDLYRWAIEHSPNPDKIPPPPIKGTLDIAKVLEADYFFA